MAGRTAPGGGWGWRQHLAYRATHLRAARGLEVGEVAAACGLSRQTVFRAERGDVVGVETVVRLAGFYGVSTDALLGRAPLPLEAAAPKSGGRRAAR